MAKNKTVRRKSSKIEQAKEAAVVFLPTFFFGLLVCGVAVFAVLSFLTADISLDTLDAAKGCITGLFGVHLAYFSLIAIGIPAGYLASCLLFLWGGMIMRTNNILGSWTSVLGGVIMVASTSLLCGIMRGVEDPMTGGLLSGELLHPAIMYFGRAGAGIAAFILLLCGTLLSFGNRVFVLSEQCARLVGAGAKKSAAAIASFATAVARVLRPRLAEAVANAGQRALVMLPRTAANNEPEKSLTVKEIKPKQKKDVVVEEKPEESDGLAEVDAAVIEDSFSRKKKSVAEEVPEALAVNSGENTLANTAYVVDEENAEGGEQAFSAVVPNLEISEDGLSGFSSMLENNENIDEHTSSSAESIQVSFEDEEVEVVSDEDNPYQRLKEQEALKKQSPAQSIADIEEEEEPQIQDSPRYTEPYVLPPLGLMDEPPPSKGNNPEQLQKRGKILEETLAQFKIQGQVVHIDRGPRITQFEMSLAPGIKLSRVSALADNIAMALKAPSVRIIAPIPGKDTIGIEIPNIDQELVTLREIVESVSREKRKQMLPLCLAKDVSGKPIVADLARMPHLLIAGATGSGKSVCINSIIMSFLTCLKYDECKLIMVDPKVVELSRFKDIPHLMSPVITDMQKAVGVLDWACQEMDQRYEKLSMVSVNNLAKFNALGAEEIERRVKNIYGEDELDHFPRKLPCVVIIIDELADLMMMAKKEVEHHIARLAAKSRAVGIHLILATQRPSTDVITGLIKANMPARIAFQVASKIDSRIILDQMGAETLLGQGDMLYLPPGVSKVQRAQGVYVSDEELFKVVDFCKAQRRPEYHQELNGPVIGSGDAGDISQYDELFLEAARLIIESGRGSVSLLQRKLGVGYGRASRIVDQLAEAGVLGPFKEGKAREILLDMDEYEARFFGGVFDGRGGGNSREPQPAMAGLRDDEKERADTPWD